MHFPQHSKPIRNRKSIFLLVSLAPLAALAAGTTLAFLTAHDSKENTFRPSAVSCQVMESFDGITKRAVAVKNTGDTAAYLRAAVVVNWQKDDGTISAIRPEVGVDYTLVLAADSGWRQGTDGYYYYADPVEKGQTTRPLIDTCTVQTAKEGYTLSVDIVASAVQSQPANAVEEAWGVTVGSDGTIQ